MGGLLDGDRSPSSGKKPRSLTSLLPFGKKKNVDSSPSSPIFNTTIQTNKEKGIEPQSATPSVPVDELLVAPHLNASRESSDSDNEE